MSEVLPTPSRSDEVTGSDIGERVAGLIGTALAVWAQPGERRRLRAYGFRPAVEEGVLKRQWHDLEVRVAPDELRVRHSRLGELVYRHPDGMTFRDGPFDSSAAALDVADQLVALINDYERWVEKREGRASRLRRTQVATADRRPTNAAAETRRLQRLLGSAWGRPPTRRR